MPNGFDDYGCNVAFKWPSVFWEKALSGFSWVSGGYWSWGGSWSSDDDTDDAQTEWYRRANYYCDGLEEGRSVPCHCSHPSEDDYFGGKGEHFSKVPPLKSRKHLTFWSFEAHNFSDSNGDMMITIIMQSDLLCIDRNYWRHMRGDIGPWQMSSDYTPIGWYHFLDQDDAMMKFCGPHI